MIALAAVCGVAYLAGGAVYASITGASPENPDTPFLARVALTPAIWFWRAVLPKNIGGGPG